MASLPLYYEDDHFIYVHAGLDKDLPMDRQSDETLLWVREDFYLNPKAYDKKKVFGHTPTGFISGENTPQWLNEGNDIAIDTGLSIEAVLDRLPTAEILDYDGSDWIVEAEVYGDGVDMWLRSQGENVEMLENR